jgi:large subunit ribosomal protein L2
MAIHNIEMIPGKGAQMVRTAGSAATLMSRDEGYAQIRLPSGEIRRVNETCFATIGQVGNPEHENVVLGKAGRSRHRGIRPLSRAVAKNPVDHPMGGGAGKTSGGGHPVTPWGVITKGFKTRRKRKDSSRFIVVRRDGRTVKQY